MPQVLNRDRDSAVKLPELPIKVFSDSQSTTSLCRGDLLLNFLVISLCVLSACQNKSSQRICEPSTQDGCLPSQHCSVDEQGTPLCLDRPNQYKLSGDYCSSSRECEPETGCINHQGYTRCMSFCSSENIELGHTQCQDRFGLASQCELTLLSRSEIGLCSQPCSLNDLSEMGTKCFTEDHCAVPLGEKYAQCIMSGQIEAKQHCNLDQNCVEPLSCVRNGSTARCQVLSSSSQDCDIGEVTRLLSGARDPFNGKAYSSCWRDVTLQSISLNGQHYRLSFELIPEPQSLELCSSLSNSVLAESLSFFDDQNVHLKTDLLSEIKSLLVEAQLNVSGFWIPLSNSDFASCQRLDLTSEGLEPTPCDLALPTLCAYELDIF